MLCWAYPPQLRKHRQMIRSYDSFPSVNVSLSNDAFSHCQILPLQPESPSDPRMLVSVLQRAVFSLTEDTAALHPGRLMNKPLQVTIVQVLLCYGAANCRNLRWVTAAGVCPHSKIILFYCQLCSPSPLQTQACWSACCRRLCTA